MSASDPHKTQLTGSLAAWPCLCSNYSLRPLLLLLLCPAPAPAVLVSRRPPVQPSQPIRAQHGDTLTNEGPSRCHHMGMISVRAAPAAVNARWEKLRFQRQY